MRDYSLLFSGLPDWITENFTCIIYRLKVHLKDPEFSSQRYGYSGALKNFLDYLHKNRQWFIDPLKHLQQLVKTLVQKIVNLFSINTGISNRFLRANSAHSGIRRVLMDQGH
jgi:hypothetical protein